MSVIRKRLLLSVLLLPLISACSDQRAGYEIKGQSHSLSLIRIVSWPWQKTAKYAVVAARMPDCMRRHALPEAGASSPVEVYAPGNDAWIIKQEGRMFVTETRTCEGFAALNAPPEGGTGPLVGTFEMRKDTLVFVPAAGAPATAPAPATPAS